MEWDPVHWRTDSYQIRRFWSENEKSLRTNARESLFLLIIYIPSKLSGSLNSKIEVQACDRLTIVMKFHITRLTRNNALIKERRKKEEKGGRRPSWRVKGQISLLIRCTRRIIAQLSHVELVINANGEFSRYADEGLRRSTYIADEIAITSTLETHPLSIYFFLNFVVYLLVVAHRFTAHRRSATTQEESLEIQHARRSRWLLVLVEMK